MLPRQTSGLAPPLFVMAVLLAVLEALLARRFSYATGVRQAPARQTNGQQVVNGGAQ